MQGIKSPEGTKRWRYTKIDGKWVYIKVGYCEGPRPEMRKINALRRNKEYLRKHNKINQYKYRQARRETLLKIYGAVCACCGEDNTLFLSIDHINNDGNVHRKKLGGSWGVWLDMIKNPDKNKYQTLCYNCNCGRSINGGICPHKGKQPYTKLKNGVYIPTAKLDTIINTKLHAPFDRHKIKVGLFLQIVP